MRPPPVAAGSNVNESKARKINILVCSANIGNQEPDQESLEAWIPKDGLMKEVVENPKYPLPEGTNPIPRRMKAVAVEVLRKKFGRLSTLSTSSPSPSLADDAKFDILVIGMQEATFDVDDTVEGMAKIQKKLGDLTRAKDHLAPLKRSIVVGGESSLRQTLGSVSQSTTNSPKAIRQTLGSVSQSITNSPKAIRQTLGSMGRSRSTSPKNSPKTTRQTLGESPGQSMTNSPKAIRQTIGSMGRSGSTSPKNSPKTTHQALEESQGQSTLPPRVPTATPPFPPPFFDSPKTTRQTLGESLGQSMTNSPKAIRQTIGSMGRSGSTSPKNSPKTTYQTLEESQGQSTLPPRLPMLPPRVPTATPPLPPPFFEGSSRASSIMLDTSVRDTIQSSGISMSERLAADADQRKGSNTDTEVLHTMLKAHLPSYSHAVSYQRGQMRLLIFFNQDEISMEVLSIKAQNTGKGGLANKGGIVSEVMVDGTTRLAFFTAHLEAHEGISKYETRCSTVADIFRGTTSSVTQIRCDAPLASHFTFAMGDLNFRTRLPEHEPGSEAHIISTHAIAESKDWPGLYTHDELVKAMQNNHCFSGFETPVCNFPPTFKVQRMKGYVYNEKRSPSYTDRILYTTGHRLRENLKVLAYEPIDDFASSDHKPIRGAFEIVLNPKLKWRPTLSKKATKRMRGQTTKSIGKPKTDDQREYLHLFISSLHVKIFKEAYNKYSEASSPSPFVCFVSTPAEALKKDTNTWDKFKRTVTVGTGGKKTLTNADGIKAWPKTRRKRNTFEASWDNEDVHFKVRTHLKDGLPIDLSGAMMHVAVFDGKTSGRLLGSFSLNLAHLIAKSREQAELEKTKNEPPKGSFSQSQSMRGWGMGRSSRWGMGPSSRSGFFPIFQKMDRHSVELPQPDSPKTLRKGRRPSKDLGKNETSRDSAAVVLDEVAEETEEEPRKILDDTFSWHPESPTGKRMQDKKLKSPLKSPKTQLKDNEWNPESPTGKQMRTKESRSAAKSQLQGTEVEKMDQDAGALKNNGGDETEDELGVLTSGPSAVLLRRAAKNWLGSMVHADNRRSSIESMNIRSMKLNRPLRKFGVDVGTIQFTIDSWWLSDKDADEKKKEREDTASSTPAPSK